MKLSQPAVELKQELVSKYGKLRHEVFVVAFVGEDDQLIAVECLFQGEAEAGHVTSDAAVVFRRARELRAKQIIIAHNHPKTADGLNDIPRPSGRDLFGTFQTGLLGALEGIPLRDHLIIGEETVYSMRSEVDV